MTSSKLFTRAWICAVLAAAAVQPGTTLADEAFDEEQARMDAKCEAARQARLAPERKRFIEECVTEEQFETREECERFYADYGNRSGNRAPLYFDLPECVEAFEHQKAGS